MDGIEPQRVAVIGAGAIGGVLAAELAGAGQAVTLCVRRPIERLSIQRGEVTREARVAIATDPGAVESVRWVLLATKTQDVPGAATWLRALGPGATTVVVQNGVNHEARVRPFVGEGAVLPSVVYLPAERTGPGHIVQHGGGRLIVPRSADGAALRELFARSAIRVEESDDLVTAQWTKLLSNIAANPITALTLRRMGVFREPAIMDLAGALIREAAAAGRAEGARLTDDLVGGVLGKVAEWANGGGGSSMLYDRLAGHPLEHDFITGAVVEAAERHGLAAPLNRAILALLKAASGHPLDGSA